MSKYYKQVLLNYLSLVSMLSILIAFVSISIFEKSYKEMINANMNEILAFNQNNLIDSIISIKDDIRFSIFQKESGQTKAILSDNISVNEYLKIKSIYDYLTMLELKHNQAVNGIHLYYKNSDIMISSKYGLKVVDEGWNKDINISWVDGVSDSDTDEIWIPTRPENLTISPVSAVEYNFSYVMAYNKILTDNTIYICIDFNELYLKDKLSHGIEGKNYVLDHNGNVISVSHGDEKLIYRNIEGFLEHEKHFQFDINDVKYLVSFIINKQTGWYLVNQYPIDSLYGALKTIKIIVIIIAAFLSIIGISISIFLAHKSYLPIKGLVYKLSSSYGVNFRQKRSEFKVIDNFITNLDLQIHKMENTVNQNRSSLESQLINDLANNRIKSYDILKERTEFLGINFDKVYYVLVNLSIKINAQNIPLIEKHMIRYELIEKINDLSDTENIILINEESEQSINLLINTNSEYGILISDKIKLITALKKILGANIKIQAIITQMTNSVLKLDEQYVLLARLKKYAFYIPDEHIITYKLLDRVNNSQSIDQKLIQNFTHSVFSMDYQNLMPSINRIHLQLLDNNCTYEVCNDAMYQLINSVTRYIEHMNYKYKGNPYSLFTTAGDIDMFKQALVKEIRNIHNDINEKNEDDAGYIINKVKQYVNDNVAENLSLNTISEKVYITPQYLSTLFKKKTGSNLSAYIISVRIDKAKHLLNDTSYSIAEIGRCIGYETSHYFIKKFKESEGMTPKQYRNHRS